MSYDPNKPNLAVNVFSFAERHRINMAADLTTHPDWEPRLAAQDNSGNPEVHITENGADYTLSAVHYYQGEMLVASRTIAEIPAGGRTEFAYWTQAAPDQLLQFSRGRGELIIVNPQNGKTQAILIDAISGLASEATLPSGTFYTIRAAADSIEPLVVSSLYEGNPDWEKLEVYVRPEDRVVAAPLEGSVAVPEDFQALVSA